MSKVSAMQSLREARYAAARAPRPAVTTPGPTVPATRTARAQPVDEVAPAVPDALDPTGAVDLLTPAAPSIAAPSIDEAPTEEALCGHRSMNNRLCRRPAGHPEKNHRYN